MLKFLPVHPDAIEQTLLLLEKKLNYYLIDIHKGALPDTVSGYLCLDEQKTVSFDNVEYERAIDILIQWVYSHYDDPPLNIKEINVIKFTMYKDSKDSDVPKNKQESFPFEWEMNDIRMMFLALVHDIKTVKLDDYWARYLGEFFNHLEKPPIKEEIKRLYVDYLKLIKYVKNSLNHYDPDKPNA